MDSEKLDHFFYRFVNNSATLFSFKINIPYIFNIVDFLQIFLILRNTEILFESNCRLGMY